MDLGWPDTFLTIVYLKQSFIPTCNTMKSQLSILDPATVGPTPVSPTLTSSTPATITLKPAAVEREVQNLLNSGALQDFNWPADQIRKNTLDLLESWKIAQAGMQRTISPITYVQLKDEKRKHYKSVLENATTTNLDAFTVITSAPSNCIRKTFSAWRRTSSAPI